MAQRRPRQQRLPKGSSWEAMLPVVRGDVPITIHAMTHGKSAPR